MTEDELLHPKLAAWVAEMAALCQPESIYVCDGSEEENRRLLEELCEAGTLRKLDESKRPNSFPTGIARLIQSS